MKGIVLAAVAAISLAGLVANPRPATAQEKEPTEITIGQASGGFLYLPLYVARGMGYLEDEGLKADVIEFKGGAPALAAVISGDIQLQLGDPTSAITARSKGAPITVFGKAMSQFGSNIVVSREVADRLKLTKDTPLEDRIAALKGLRLGISSSGSSTDKIFRELARAGGMNPDRDLTLVPLGTGGATLAAFAKGRVDGFARSSPTGELAVAENDAFMLINLSAGEYAPLRGFPTVGLLAREDWLKGNPETATSVVRALWRAEKLIHDDPQKAADAARSFYSGVSDEIYAKAFEINQPAYSQDPRLTDEGMKIANDFLKEGGGNAWSGPIKELYTNEYVDRAKGEGL